MPSYDLVCPFLDDSASFAAGVEFATVYAQMNRDRVITGYFLLRNQDQILLAAHRLGWSVVRMEPSDSFWFWLKIRRRTGNARREPCK